jgi:hypothetical protein
VRACLLWCMAIMAGMLPGVECARRRRLRRSGAVAGDAAAGGGGSRRLSFCLYAAGHGGHPAGAGNPAKVVSDLLGR